MASSSGNSCSVRGALADGRLDLSWTPGDEYIAERDDAIIPLGHDGRLEDDSHPSGLGEVVPDLLRQPLLSEHSVDREDDQREEGRGSNKDPDNVTEEEPGDKCAPFIGIP